MTPHVQQLLLAVLRDLHLLPLPPSPITNIKNVPPKLGLVSYVVIRAQPTTQPSQGQMQHQSLQVNPHMKDPSDVSSAAGGLVDVLFGSGIPIQTIQLIGGLWRNCDMNAMLVLPKTHRLNLVRQLL
jgi:hypothetical protein